MLDDLPPPSELEGAGLSWVPEEFPWSHGRTIITTRAEQWVQDEKYSREVTETERRFCDKCGLFSASGAMQKCEQCRNVYYCSAACQKQAWAEHKPVCVAIPVIRRSVAGLMGLSVGSFGEDEACSWIKSKVRRWRNEDAGVMELVQHLGCLPLAMGQVTAYARVHNTATAAEYLALLKLSTPGPMAETEELKVGGKVKVHSLKKAGEHNGKHGVLLGYDGEAGRWSVKLDGVGAVAVRVRAANLTSLSMNDKCPEGLSSVVMLSLGKICGSEDGYGEAAAQAALKMALMDQGGIPLELLSCAERQGVSLLAQHALVTVNDKGLGAMHALTQLVVREQQLTDKAERGALAATVVQRLADKLGKFAHMKPATHFIGQRYGRHAMAVAGHVGKWGLLEEAGGERGRGTRTQFDRWGPELLKSVLVMCNYSADFFLNVGGQYGKAKSLAEMSLRFSKGCYGCAHEATAESYTDLGNACYRQGKYEQAMALLTKSLEIHLSLYEPDSIQVARSYFNLGHILSMQGEMDEALTKYMKALKIHLKVMGPEHADVALLYNSLGSVYQSQCKYDQAIVEHKKALKIQLKVLGPDHVDVSFSYSNLGMVHANRGRYDDALHAHSKALEIRLKVLGQQHPDVASSYSNLGIVHNEQGRYDAALHAHSKALEINLKVLNPEQATIARSYHNLGVNYCCQNKHEEAVGEHMKALKIQLKVLGPEDEDVAMSYNSLGVIYLKQGKHEEAMKVQTKALKIKLKLLGRVHPEVARSYGNLGTVYLMQDKVDEALREIRKALEIQLEMLEPDHPDLARSYGNLGLIYKRQGKHEEAVLHFLKAWKIQRKVFGNGHPDVIATLFNIQMMREHCRTLDNCP